MGWCRPCILGGFVLLLQLGNLNAELVVPEDENKCAYWPGAIYLNGRCVRFYDTLKTWDDAKTFCEGLDYGGKLVELKSQSDRDALVPQARGIVQSVWIGLSDQDQEGMYKWGSDTQPADIVQSWWAPGQPNGGVEDCVFMEVNGNMHDIVCSASIAFYCERSHVSTSNPCAYWPGSFALGGRCLKLINLPRKFDDAQSFCTGLGDGGTLAEPQSMAELLQLKNILLGTGSHVWIGATDRETEGVWRWTSSNEQTDLSQYWLPGQPDNAGNNEHCAHLHAPQGLLNDIYCDNTFPFLCQRTRQDALNPCDYWPGSIPINGRCFKVINELKTADEAEDFCKSLEGGGHLGEIRSQAEKDQLEPSLITSPTQEFWIGASDRNREGTWVWRSNGDPAVLGPWWSPGQPDNAGNIEHCAHLLTNGKVNDNPCSNRKLFLCERSRDRTTDPCIGWPGSFHLHEHCYKLYTETKTWQNAQNFCSNLAGGGGSLAEVRSTPEFQQLQPAVLGVSQDVWIGGNDREREGSWVWASNGDEVLFGPHWWSGGQPDNGANIEDCGHFLSNGLINDKQCSHSSAFICQYYVGPATGGSNQGGPTAPLAITLAGQYNNAHQGGDLITYSFIPACVEGLGSDVLFYFERSSPEGSGQQPIQYILALRQTSSTTLTSSTYSVISQFTDNKDGTARQGLSIGDLERLEDCDSTIEAQASTTTWSVSDSQNCAVPILGLSTDVKTGTLTCTGFTFNVDGSTVELNKVGNSNPVPYTAFGGITPPCPSQG